MEVARHLGKLLPTRGVRRAHLVMHDFGGPWGLTRAANNPQAVASGTSWAHSKTHPWYGLSLPCCSGCNLQHNRKKRPVCAGCHTSRPALGGSSVVAAGGRP